VIAMRALRWILVAVVAIVLGALGWFLSHRKSAHATSSAPAASSERVVPVVVATVEKRDVPIVLEGLGNVTPLFTVVVHAQVDGRLDAVRFTEGQAVRKGQIIAQVDARPFVIQLHNAEAALARDQATLRNAQLDLGRYTELRAQNLIPQQQLDQQRTLVDTSQAAIRADEAQIESARLQLDYAAIKAPIDGVTGVRLVDPGNLVHTNDPTVIVVITQLDPIAVMFTLPEDDLPRVAKELARGPLRVEAFNRDGTQRLAEGTLALVDNQINAQTATIRLKAKLPNPERQLWPNQFIKARLRLATREGALVVPAAALQRGPQGTFVYVVGDGDIAKARAVEIESTQGEIAIVASGLSAGERVVAEGQNQLRPGAKVAPRAAPAGSSRESDTRGARP
jgi:multidrug efflux system membrane fusion protein